MGRKKTVSFPWPLGGLDKSRSRRLQPPYTSYDMLNVRARETVEGRARGGQRPGLRKAFAQDMGGAVRMMSQVTYAGATSGAYYFFWEDEFDRDGADLGEGWNNAAWLSVGQPPTKRALGGALTYRPKCGAVCDALNYDKDKPYTVEVEILPYAGEHWGTYYIYARMSDATPNVQTSGIEVRLTLTGSTGAYSGKLLSYSGGGRTTYNFTAGSTGSATAGAFKIYVDGNSVQCSWQDVVLLTQTVASTQTGKRVGFGMKTVGYWPNGLCLVDAFKVHGSPTGGSGSQLRRTYFVASASGKLYVDRTIGTLSQVTGSVADFSDSHLFLAQERAQKLYIADYDPPRITGTDGTLSVTFLTATSVTNWTSYGIDKNTDVVVISNGLGTVVNGTYKISLVTATRLVLAAAAGSGGCTYRVVRAPKIYDPATNAVSLWFATAGKGAVPSECPLICLYRDRLVLAGWPPHEWYMSKQGDALDWEYIPDDPNDAGRAVSGQNSDAGLVGDVINAMVPFSDDYIVFGCQGSLWVMRGDPAAGGNLDALSYDAGIIAKKAWAQGPNGELVFLSYNGLYILPPGARSVPEPLSARALPEDFRAWNPATHEPLLLWDDEESGIHIYRTPIRPTGWSA